MLEKLTPQQEKLMETVRNDWSSLFFSGKEIDRKKATEGIHWLYDLSGLKKPVVVFVESPLAAQIAVPYAKTAIEELTKDKNRYDQLYRQLYRQVRDQVRDQVGDQVRGQVGDQLYGQLYRQVRDQVGGQFENFASYANYSDFGWLSFYDFFDQIGINLKNENFYKFKELIRSGVYDMIQLDGLCIVAQLPLVVHRNESNFMHNAHGAAIEWRDGYKLYYLNGIHFPQALYEKVISGSMPFAEILAIEDIDQRTQAMRFGDVDEFLRHVKAVKLDSYIKTSEYISKPVEYALYRIPKGDLFQEDVHYMAYNCPSTDKKYMSGVPEFKTVAEAMSWKMGDDETTITPQDFMSMVPLLHES